MKSEVFPLAAILRRLLAIGQSGMNRPVEVEFAVDLDSEPQEFAILQVRPSVRAGDDLEAVDIDGCKDEEVLCYSKQALGNGVIDIVHDILYVRPETFDSQRTEEIAEQIGTLNDELLSQNRPLMLIGPGRWGSSTRSLGIPVIWGQISAARIIVETTLENFTPDPSQGSHFFQNLVSFGIAYLTVDARNAEDFVDWDWLAAQKAEHETEFVRHVRLSGPIEARVDGHSSRAVVIKHTHAPVDQ